MCRSCRHQGADLVRVCLRAAHRKHRHDLRPGSSHLRNKKQQPFSDRTAEILDKKNYTSIHVRIKRSVERPNLSGSSAALHRGKGEVRRLSLSTHLSRILAVRDDSTVKNLD